MDFKWLKTGCLGILFIFICLPTQAVSIEPDIKRSDENNLRLAKDEYQKGNYLVAKQYFEIALEHALSQNKPTDTINYNLGSVSYKLKLYSQSKTYFNKLLNHHKLKAVAYYNLALIENKLLRKKSAMDYLHKSKKNSSDKQFTKLIDQQIVKISKSKQKKINNKRLKDWHAYLYVGSGHDSNINFAPLEVASNESGGFLQGIGIFDKRIAGDGYGVKKSALLITSTIFLSNYYSTNFNDYDLFDVGLRYLKPVDKWRNVLEVNYKKSTYGHRDYQQISAITLKTKRKLLSGDTLRLRYRYEQFESLDTLFDYLEGNRQKIRAGYQFKWSASSAYLWYEFESNNRTNTANLNYSPVRNTLRLRFEKKIDVNNKVYVELEQRDSDYEVTLVQDRRDKRAGVLLAYSNTLSTDWKLQARWGFRRNRSTETAFSYDRHIILLTAKLTY